MEAVLSGHLGNVLVGANTAGFEGFAGDLFYFVREQVHGEWEIVNGGFLAAKVVDFDFGVWDCTAEA